MTTLAPTRNARDNTAHASGRGFDVVRILAHNQTILVRIMLFYTEKGGGNMN